VQAEYTLAEIAAIVGGEYLAGTGESPCISQYAFDTRKLHSPATTVFLALQGELRDGHSFAARAYQLGVRNFWVTHALSLTDAHQLIVPDVLGALQKLAAYHRTQFAYPVVAITGSNGKTTVKEWLASLLQGHQLIVKSPRSFNSQLGVALSLLLMRQHHTLALIEAGISRRGEMQRLAEMIKPTHGVLTHMGDAHAEGFADENEKLTEKLKLFKGLQYVWCTADDENVLAALARENIQPITVGTSPSADVRVHLCQYTGDAWHWKFEVKSRVGILQPMQFKVAGPAALENILLSLLAAHPFLRSDASNEDLQRSLDRLTPVSMRTEMITDNPEVTILNDAYNADADSVLNAFTLLQQQKLHPRRTLILSDMEHLGAEAEATQRMLLERALHLFGAEAVTVVGVQYAKLASQHVGIHAYETREALLRDFEYERFVGSTVLLKGARRYELERVIPALSKHPGATYLKINLNHLRQNLDSIRRMLPPGTRTLAMLKAAAYGAGSWQIAQELADAGVDYFGVAVTNEGLELRRRGIQPPILVLNADVAGLRDLVMNSLEPAIWSIEMLTNYAQLGDELPPIHLEFDTGMARLGFAVPEVAQVLEVLNANPHLQVATVFTHLAASEEPGADDFTMHQLMLFEQAWRPVLDAYPNVWVHALNTGGILRFGKHEQLKHMQMVRLGIGLYGVSPVPELQGMLQEVGSLHTSISQIHTYPAGATVGYNRSEVLSRDSRIATLPIGYADGLSRALGNRKLSLMVREKWAPIVGRVCMDMVMIDVTDIPEAVVGDEVQIFGKQGGLTQSVQVLAQLQHTIAYEVLAGIPQRVRRVYVKE